MPTIKQIRQGIAANLATVPGLRTSYYVPDNPNPPVAIIYPPAITYDQSFGRGLDKYDLQVIVLVAKLEDRIAQDLIDTFCAPVGTGSVKAAIEADRSLGGTVSDLRVTNMTGVTPTTIADGQLYLTATWAVEVYAQ